MIKVILPNVSTYTKRQLEYLANDASNRAKSSRNKPYKRMQNELAKICRKELRSRKELRKRG